MISRLIQLVIYLIVPILGILVFGWDWRSVILLYWLENITVGISTIIAIARTPRMVDPLQEQRTQWTINGQPAQRMPKALLIPFFILHYGIFTLVHGVFVFLLIGGFFGLFSFAFAQAPLGGSSYQFGFGQTGIDLYGILIAWGIASIIQLVLGLRQPRELLPPATELFFSPYKRILVLHFTVLFGAVIIAWLGWPPASALLLVALHFVTDLPQLKRELRSPTQP